jgi:hypothetical protein
MEGAMIDGIFDGCVVLLLFLADLFGMSYKAINVWIFVIIWPAVTLALMSVVVRQQLKIRGLVDRAKRTAQPPDAVA